MKPLLPSGSGTAGAVTPGSGVGPRSRSKVAALTASQGQRGGKGEGVTLFFLNGRAWKGSS